MDFLIDSITSSHGGPDALGVPTYDLSSNGNTCGPCPDALRVLQEANACHYPDPASTALRAQLAAWHGVAPKRIVIAASASEFIQRISVAVALEAESNASVWQPPHAYGDYARAAHAAGLSLVGDAEQATLLWGCDPSSPLGQPQPDLSQSVDALRDDQTLVLDLAYAPLRLEGTQALDGDQLDRVWRLVTPNKALGLTGMRAAYAIAPRRVAQALLARIQMLAPSWPLGAHGVALLQCWATVSVHDWLVASRATLRHWKRRQICLLQAAGWLVEPSVANFFVVSDGSSDTGAAARMARRLSALRQRGIKLRDCGGFGLPGRVRMTVVAPKVQDVLLKALQEPV